MVAIPYSSVRRVYEARPELLWSVVSLLAERLRNMDGALADAVFLDVTGRTAKRLLEMAGDADEFTLPVTQEELAGMVGRLPRAGQQGPRPVRPARLDRAAERRYRITNRQQLEISRAR